MGRQVAAEWIKAVSLRSTWVLLGLGVLGEIAQALQGVIGYEGTAAGPQTLDVMSGSGLTLVVVTIVGVFLAASEYGSKSIVSTYTVTADRTRVVIAKAAVALALAAALGVVSVPLARLVAVIWFALGGAGHWDAGLATAVHYGYGTVIAYAGFAVVGVAIGVLSRSIAIGVGVAFFGLFVLDAILGSVSFYSEYSFTAVAEVLNNPDVHQDGLPRFGSAIALMALYAGLLTAIGVGVERRRDVE
jgi:ABC-2 type transport system permease protein